MDRDLTASVVHKTKAGERKHQNEDEWVEAEIKRLLLHVQVDEGEETTMSPTPDLPGGTERWKGDASVDHVFSHYFSSLGTNQSDVQDLISDALTALNSAAGSLTKAPDTFDDTEQVIRDLNVTLSHLEDKEGASINSVTTEAHETVNIETHEHFKSETESSIVQEDKLLTLKVHSTDEGPSSNASCRIEAKPKECGVFSLPCMEAAERVPKLEGTNIEEISKGSAIHDLPEDSTSDEVCILMEPGDLEIEADELNPELLAALKQAKNDQKMCEEQLSTELRNREAELTIEIQQAQRMIVEYQEAEIARAKIVEQSRHKAAIILQSHWRSYSVRNIYGKQLYHLKQQRLQQVYRAAQLLQAHWRGFATRKKYKPVIEVQRALRQERLQQEAKIRNQCAIKIQALWKGFCVRRILQPTLSALKEKRISETLRIREELNRKLNSMASRIQTNWRGYFVRKIYTPVLRERMSMWKLKRKHKRNLAATKLQACWRGHSERQRTGQWLIEQKRMKKAVEEKQQRAACVLQTYWRMHCCRKQFLQRRKNKNSEVSQSPSTKEHKTTSHSPRGSGRLTVSRRLESALSLKSHIEKNGAGSILTSCGATTTKQQLRVTSGGKENEDKKVMQHEEQALASLHVSRQKEKHAAQQARIKIRQAMVHSEAEKALQEKQNYANYQNEVLHCSSPIPAQVRLDVVHERLQKWFISITTWREPSLPIAEGQPVPIPTARHQPVTKALSNADLLAASPEETSPSQVEKVVLKGCGFVPDVSSLSCCHRLYSLDIMSCGLSSLTSLPSTLPLTALNLRGNVLEQMDLRSVSSTLKFLNLSENKLGSVHGLEGCSNLLDLDLSGNRITRLGGFAPCWHLQNLSAESNLLVSSTGLQGLPYLQTLSCARNHLPVPPDVSHSSLLTMLHLQQNNLQEVPSLPHHVVLRELRLEDNSLTDVSPICQAWLPLLQTLSLARNCITDLESLLPLIMLNVLDISNNSIYDLPMLLKGFQGCMELQSVSLEGNPVAQEPQLHSHLISVVPKLDSVDGQPVSHQYSEKFELPDLVTSSPVYQLCKRQLLEQDKLKRLHIEAVNRASMEIPHRTRKLIETKVEHRKQLECLLVQHVKQQEELGQKSVGGVHEEINVEHAQECPASQDTDKLVSAAIVIQAAWRGHVSRTAVAAVCHAAVRIQARWRRVLARRSFQLMREQKRKHIWAATVIQAMYRGYWVRRGLREVIQHAKYVSDEENSLEEDIDLNMKEEDLFGDDFPFIPPSPTCHPTTLNNAATCISDNLTDKSPAGIQYDSQWEALDTHQRSGIPDFPGGDTCGDHHPGDTLTDHSTLTTPAKDTLARDGEKWGPPTQAWTEVSQGTPSVGVSQGSPSPTSEKRGAKENLVDEWGLKTDTTVHLLMKRARRQKMFKNKAAHRKRMADPAERLAVFQRKGHSMVANITPGLDQFHSHTWRQHIPLSHTPQMPSVKMYRWEHEHTVVHKDVEKCASGQLPQLKAKCEQTLSTSSCSLPQLDQRVLAGHAPTLVAQDPRGNTACSQDFDRKSIIHNQNN